TAASARPSARTILVRFTLGSLLLLGSDTSDGTVLAQVAPDRKAAATIVLQTIGGEVKTSGSHTTERLGACLTVCVAATILTEYPTEERLCLKVLHPNPHMVQGGAITSPPNWACNGHKGRTVYDEVVKVLPPEWLRIAEC